MAGGHIIRDWRAPETQNKALQDVSQIFTSGSDSDTVTRLAIVPFKLLEYSRYQNKRPV